MALTFDVRDPAQHEAYLTETCFQWLAHGQLYLTFSEAEGRVTVLEPGEARTWAGAG
jgi:hypothetical protein